LAILGKNKILLFYIFSPSPCPEGLIFIGAANNSAFFQKIRICFEAGI